MNVISNASYIGTSKPRWLLLLVAALILLPNVSDAEEALILTGSDWPRSFEVEGAKASVFQPQIESFDQFVVLLKNTVSQMVYKHAISTVVPSRPVRMSTEDEGED